MKQKLIEIAQEASNYREGYGYDYTSIRAAENTESAKNVVKNVIPKMFEWVNGYDELGGVLGFLLGIPKPEIETVETDLDSPQRYKAANLGSDRFQRVNIPEEKQEVDYLPD